MKQFMKGLLIGVLLMTGVFIFIGATTMQEDSVEVYMDRFEKLIREEIAKNISSGRFQLQSFSIDRTHWHYMLDTTTGKLYRMELGRTPDRSEWVLMAQGMFQQEDFNQTPN